MSATASYEVAEVSERADFLLLESEWNALLDECACDLPFMRHEWFRIWLDHFGEGRRLSIITARRNGRLVLALPMGETREAWMLIPFVLLRSLTNAHSFRFQVLLARGEEPSVRAAWDYLRKRPRAWNLIEFERFPTGFPADETLLLAARESGRPAGVWRGGISPYLPLRGTWEGYLASLKPKFRSNMRNRLKRLQSLGAIEYEVVTAAGDCAAALEDAFAIEASGWKGDEQSAIAQDAGLEDFYTKWAALAAERGWLRLWFLRLDGRRVAFEYDVEYKGVLYCMKIGYDPKLHPYSAGQILKAAVLERAFAQGLREYDFLGVMDEAKGNWTAEGRPFNWFYLYNGSIPSRLHHAFKFAVTPGIKRMLRR